MARPPGLIHARGLPPVACGACSTTSRRISAESMTQRRLAGIAQLSMDHFARLFRHSTGLPPHRYVLQRRIARARELVAERRLSLAEIGYDARLPEPGPLHHHVPPARRHHPRRLSRDDRRRWGTRHAAHSPITWQRKSGRPPLPRRVTTGWLAKDTFAGAGGPIHEVA